MDEDVVSNPRMREGDHRFFVVDDGDPTEESQHDTPFLLATEILALTDPNRVSLRSNSLADGAVVQDNSNNNNNNHHHNFFNDKAQTVTRSSATSSSAAGYGEDMNSLHHDRDDDASEDEQSQSHSHSHTAAQPAAADLNARLTSTSPALIATTTTSGRETNERVMHSLISTTVENEALEEDSSIRRSVRSSGRRSSRNNNRGDPMRLAAGDRTLSDESTASSYSHLPPEFQEIYKALDNRNRNQKAWVANRDEISEIRKIAERWVAEQFAALQEDNAQEQSSSQETPDGVPQQVTQEVASKPRAATAGNLKTETNVPEDNESNKDDEDTELDGIPGEAPPSTTLRRPASSGEKIPPPSRMKYSAVNTKMIIPEKYVAATWDLDDISHQGAPSAGPRATPKESQAQVAALASGTVADTRSSNLVSEALQAHAQSKAPESHLKRQVLDEEIERVVDALLRINALQLDPAADVAAAAAAEEQVQESSSRPTSFLMPDTSLGYEKASSVSTQDQQVKFVHKRTSTETSHESSSLAVPSVGASQGTGIKPEHMKGHPDKPLATSKRADRTSQGGESVASLNLMQCEEMQGRMGTRRPRGRSPHSRDRHNRASYTTVQDGGEQPKTSHAKKNRAVREGRPTKVQDEVVHTRQRSSSPIRPSSEAIQRRRRRSCSTPSSCRQSKHGAVDKNKEAVQASGLVEDEEPGKMPAIDAAKLREKMALNWNPRESHKLHSMWRAHRAGITMDPSPTPYWLPRADIPDTITFGPSSPTGAFFFGDPEVITITSSVTGPSVASRSIPGAYRVPGGQVKTPHVINAQLVDDSRNTEIRELRREIAQLKQQQQDIMSTSSRPAPLVTAENVDYARDVEIRELRDEIQRLREDQRRMTESMPSNAQRQVGLPMNAGWLVNMWRQQRQPRVKKRCTGLAKCD